MTSPRIGADRLVRILESLSSSDVAVLGRLEQHRYLQTDQLARFEFADRPTHLASLRAAHRSLKRLRQLGLILMLERTIGGTNRGSSAAVWTLTNTGLRASQTAAGDSEQPRRRFAEPTLIFLRHEVAVADLHLQLIEATRAADDAELHHLELEPTCWRRYVGPLGSILTLKPDMSAHVETGRYDSVYFFEVDRATEPPHRIVAKSLQYQEYYRTGDEERRSRVLPLIIWVVPTEARRQQLHRHLTPSNGINPHLYRVLLPDEIERLITDDDEVGVLSQEKTRDD